MEIRGYKIPEIVHMDKPKSKDVMVEEVPMTITVGIENRGDKIKHSAHKRFTKKGKKIYCEESGKEFSSMEDAVGMTAHYMINELMKK